MSNCSATTIARRKPGIRRRSSWRVAYVYRCWPRKAHQYAKPEERQILDVFTCIRNHRTLDTAGRLLARNSERYLKTPQAMQQLFADLPEAIANTMELSSRLEFTLKDLGYEFPRYPVPEGETMDSFLRARTMEGARDRYLRPGQSELWQRAQRQIERELALIKKLKLGGLFPYRVGHRAPLPRAGHSGARTRLGGQQRGLLFARHHCGRSRRHGVAVRALSVGRAWRVARHRSRSSQRRSARARHSVCLRTLRQAGCGHDRQRHHLSRTLGGARGWQGTQL